MQQEIKGYTIFRPPHIPISNLIKPFTKDKSDPKIVCFASGFGKIKGKVIIYTNRRYKNRKYLIQYLYKG